MEFLNSLDLDNINKKSHRVRSWYLYEQFKSLERSQLEAAQKLKDRSYQERILRQELSERRARRKLYNQFGLCQSEAKLKKASKADSIKTSVSESDDFFESFYNLHEDERMTQLTGAEFSDTFSQEDLLASKCCIQNFKSGEDHQDDNCSYTGSVTSVVENLKPLDSGDDSLPSKEMEFMQKSIVEDINMQLESVKEDLLGLEKFAKLENIDKISEDDSFDTIAIRELKHVAVREKTDQDYDNYVIAMWSRLVSFAYQIVQLNHGNCYCDYSSQFLTAVLACDVLRKGVNIMCHILQPYVSPIKFANESDASSASSNINVKRKKSVQVRKCRKICENKSLSSCKKPKTYIKRGYSERKFLDRKNTKYCWQPLCKQLCNIRTRAVPRYRRASEPRRSFAQIYDSEEISQKFSSSSSRYMARPFEKKAFYGF